MKKPVAEIVSRGFAKAFIEYRLSIQPVFQAQIQNCNQAISSLYDNAETNRFDKQCFAFSPEGFLIGAVTINWPD